jgi:predicted glutamine amidotransferase
VCGVFGIVKYGKSNITYNDLNSLAQNSLRRGKDAFGLYVYDGHSHKIWKNSGYIKNPLKKIKSLKSSIINMESGILIGHARLATDGNPLDNINNQPIVLKEGVFVHNGIVVNSDLISKNNKLHTSTRSDSEVLGLYIQKLIRRHTKVDDVLKDLFSNIKGSASFAYSYSCDTHYELLLGSNTGSLYWMNGNGYLIFSSEKYFLSDLGRKNKIINIRGGKGLLIGLNEEGISIMKEVGIPKKIVIYHNDGESIRTKEADTNNKLHVLEKHKINMSFVNNLVRCRKCILPETTPFIIFDKSGLCNYCMDHKPIKYKGKKALEKLLLPYKKNGKPNCILAFSGGRDSSYGLHYLVKELGMNPVVFTYDWGMMSDIGRRNQARMVGSLGVEHIIRTPDIMKNRRDIKQNILAWTKSPDLGMIPLFMQGDKVAEYYVDRLRKQLGIDLVFFCRGNELEKEEFKAGYCGIEDADPGGVIHNLSMRNKTKLITYYLKQFAKNPLYINRSLVSTMLGYITTYIVPHDYVYLWHYIPWNEKEIISTLKSEYDWETSKNTISTWRIDDGSPAFYNYIYYQLQGSTENDSFRSRQIREGKLSRGEAIRLVGEENKPRYRDLKWYFDVVGLDGDSILNVIDSVVGRM